jgi:predicted SAM-dependent methyltransferase
VRLHIGCGPFRLEGWVNIDNTAYEGVDQILDVTGGLPFENVQFIFAEHFIEHLAYEDALMLMRECRRALNPGGILRLSTPNLDWVWASHYRRVLTSEQEVLGCFLLNRAFRAWGHQFLYNFGTLAAALRDAGFAEVVRCEYGKSEFADLNGLERHEQDPDFDGLSHILIVEARGTGGQAPDYYCERRDSYLRDVKLK